MGETEFREHTANRLTKIEMLLEFLTQDRKEEKEARKAKETTDTKRQTECMERFTEIETTMAAKAGAEKAASESVISKSTLSNAADILKLAGAIITALAAAKFLHI